MVAKKKLTKKGGDGTVPASPDIGLPVIPPAFLADLRWPGEHARENQRRTSSRIDSFVLVRTMSRSARLQLDKSGIHVAK